MIGIRLKFVFVFVITCAVLFVSFNKIVFLVQISQFSLSPKFEKRTSSDFLVRNYSKNRRLSFLIRSNASNELFTASFLKGLIKKAKRSPEDVGIEDFIPLIIDKFSENIFVEHLGLYGRINKDRVWDNFDPLFLKIIEDPDLNEWSQDILIESVRSDKIEEESLPSLVYYLNWKDNFDLSRALLSWGSEEGILDDKMQHFLASDLSARQAKLTKRITGAGIVEEEIEGRISGLLGVNESTVDLEEDLIHDGGFAEMTSLLEFWTFSDMSDRDPFSRGSFYGGIDEFENKSVRIMGFFSEKTGKRSFSRAGFWYIRNIPLEKKVYLFYFKYKTLEGTESPSFWLSRELKKEPRLKPTNMDWRECFYLFDNEKMGLSSVRPLLRLWGLGSVWFDDVGLFEMAPEGISIEKDLLIIQ